MDYWQSSGGAPGPRPRSSGSESRQALRAVVRDGRAGDLFERTVRLDGVADELRRVAVDLVQAGAGGAYPAVARAAADGPVERAAPLAIARNLRAGGVLDDGDHVAVDAVASEVAVAEIRREHQAVIRGAGEPAQFGRLAP